MTSTTARTVANLVLVSAGVAAAFVVVTTPPLRRLVARGTRHWLGAGAAAYLADVTRQAWTESARSA